MNIEYSQILYNRTTKAKNTTQKQKIQHESRKYNTKAENTTRKQKIQHKSRKYNTKAEKKLN